MPIHDLPTSVNESRLNHCSPNFYQNSIMALIIGDFSREATIRFCNHVSIMEYRVIRAALPPEAVFYDEYRRIPYCILGDLPFLKKKGMNGYGNGLLDDRILVGFPGGITLQNILPRMVMLVFHSLWGPVRRNVRNVKVMFPCNTLAPLAWEMETIFSSQDKLLGMIADTTGNSIDDTERDVAEKIVEKHIRIDFPTIPEVVIHHVWESGLKTLIPLGTLNIDETYKAALRRAGLPLQVIAPDERQQTVILEAIKSGISAEPGTSILPDLVEVTNQLRRQYGDSIAIVKACTDLTCDMGLDSNAIYAESLVKSVYGAAVI